MKLGTFDMNRFTVKKEYFFVFILSFVLAVSFFLPYIIADNGYFFYLGDYNCQQIPFNILANDAVKSGNIFWNWNTDLGANFIGSYSFYLLGSPFFWLMLFLPASIVPMAMPWVLCLKFAVSGITSYAFISRFVKNKNYALFGALMYAFSSFSIYNIFFNHFNDVIALFPLLLIGLEEYMQKGRKGIFAVTVFINALCNYYFFVAEVVFLIIYFFIRMYQDEWPDFTFKKFIGLAFESMIGFGLAAFLIFPAVLTTLQIPRAGTKLAGWALIYYYELQRPLQILQAFFFPPEIPSQLGFFSNAGGKWSSVTAWLPLFGMVGAFSWIRRPKRDWLAKIIITLCVMAFFPVLNATFQLFSNSFYTRWFFMLVLMLALSTARSMEECSEREIRGGMIWTAFITSAIALPIVLIFDPSSQKTLANYPDRVWAYFGISMLCLTAVYFLIFMLKRTSRHFAVTTLVILCVIITGYGNFNIVMGRFSGIGDANAYVDRNIEGRDNIDLPDLDNVRIDVVNGEENEGMFWKIPTIQAFHSIVPGSIMEFYPLVGVERNVASRPELSHIALRSFLSVKYLFDGNNDDAVGAAGFQKIDVQNGFGVWENTNYIPYGFTYDQYISLEDWMSASTDSRERLLLKAIVLDVEEEEKYSHLFEKYAGSLDVSGGAETGEAELSADCALRREGAATYFSRDNLGFDSKITTDKATLVFFSVPYEPGWTVTVNGKTSEIIKTNVGFMSVMVEAGESEIRFNYMTPGLIPGAAVCLLCLMLLLAYLFLLPRILRTPACQAFCLRFRSRIKVRRVSVPQEIPDEAVPDDEQRDGQRDGKDDEQNDGNVNDIGNPLGQDSRMDGEANQALKGETGSVEKETETPDINDGETPDIKEYKLKKNQ